MVVTQADSVLWLGQFLRPFLRVTGLFLTAPFYNSALIPRPVKLALALAYAVSLALWLPALAPFPADPAAIFLQGAAELGIGALAGMIMQIVVATIACAGEIAGLSLGLGFAELQFREATSVTPVLYDIMFWVGLLGYILAGGPFILFAALAHSFQSGLSVAALPSWNALSTFGGQSLNVALWLAMPVVALSLCVNLMVGIASIFAPQLNLLSIGFPVLILAGLSMFTASTLYFNHAIIHLLNSGIGYVALILNHG